MTGAGLRSWLEDRRSNSRHESGVVAVIVAFLAVVLLSIAAFTVDVGSRYVEGHREQRAADAAALAGVVYLPGNPAKATATALKYAAANGYDDADPTIVVSVKVDKTPTRLRVSITHKINNSFAGLIGFPTATISRSSVADWAEPVPLGSPCNEFGNDPDSPNTSGVKSTRCAGADQFWANIGSPAAAKGNGDAFQNGTCSGEDSCSGTTNADYDANGYFYTVNVEQATTNLRIDVFDPALISVGDLCDSSQSDNSSIQNAAKLKPSTDKNPEAVVPDPATRYAAGPDSPYCTGDISYNAKNQRDINQVSTSYTIRNPPANPWDPLSGTVRTDCTGAKTYPGYAGDLSKALNQKHADYKVVTPGFGQGYVAQVFRRWVPLCTIASAPAGTYTIQVHTNGVGQDYAAGHNRFALRAYSTTDSTAKDKVSVSGFNKMAIYANLPNATTSFFLTKVPAGARGQTLNVRLFDIGDSTGNGTVKVVPPPDSGLTKFTGCKGFGVTGGTAGTNLTDCAITANSTYNGKWQTVSVPIPTNYTCSSSVPTGCWVRLQYAYGSGNQPSDTTSWTAGIEGDPVRLVE